MAKKLLIVESPAKAKTIGKYLGGDFVVKSSVGHIRDLPKENGAIKIEEVGEGKWKFTPVYEVSEGDHSWKWWDLHIQSGLDAVLCDN